MGILECDDGNQLEGDGCSSLCKIEDGFICSGGDYLGPDICLEIIPPFISHLLQPTIQTLRILFIEYVLFKGNYILLDIS